LSFMMKRFWRGKGRKLFLEIFSRCNGGVMAFQRSFFFRFVFGLFFTNYSIGYTPCNTISLFGPVVASVEDDLAFLPKKKFDPPHYAPCENPPRLFKRNIETNPFAEERYWLLRFNFLSRITP
jgi:hypothetical protein